MKSLNTSDINLENIKEALKRMLKTAVEYNMTNEKIQSVIYQYLVHLETKNIIRDFIEPAIKNVSNVKLLRVELAISKWVMIDVYSDPYPSRVYPSPAINLNAP